MFEGRPLQDPVLYGIEFNRWFSCWDSAEFSLGSMADFRVRWPSESLRSDVRYVSCSVIAISSFPFERCSIPCELIVLSRFLIRFAAAPYPTLTLDWFAALLICVIVFTFFAMRPCVEPPKTIFLFLRRYWFTAYLLEDSPIKTSEVDLGTAWNVLFYPSRLA